MKVFWSWQSDTPGKVGRHFARQALEGAIAAIKKGDEIEEPSERESRDAIHLDHDRKGVSGSPDLANMIFDKITAATVFVADVTLVGESLIPVDEGNRKKFINSNVAIEFGFARQCVSDRRILMVQNTHYGSREELPFDLRHKSGPIQFRLALDATKEEIARERERLKGELTVALKACFESVVVAMLKFQETPATSRPAYFWKHGETLAVFETNFTRLLPEDERVDFTFDEPHAFYLRLIPTLPLPKPLTKVRLLELGKPNNVAVLTRRRSGSAAVINSYGVIVYDSIGNSSNLIAFTQLFQNGELWGVSREMVFNHYGEPAVAALNLRNQFSQTLYNFKDFASMSLHVPPPYRIEMGVVGLTGLRLSFPPENELGLSREFFDDSCIVTKVADITETTVPAMITEFMQKLCDLVGLEYSYP